MKSKVSLLQRKVYLSKHVTKKACYKAMSAVSLLQKIRNKAYEIEMSTKVSLLQRKHVTKKAMST